VNGGPASVDMQVLAVLNRRHRDGAWVTPEEILPYTSTTKLTGVTSAIRRLRVKGFNIRRKKRAGRIDEYFLFHPAW
jgi:hypothetical protein